ncbi:carboxypeptidase-like regulatory domain-containing protein [bacterium SCSIO 12643]|nr:carboxypeptidase-like regulatory domain-containing protein [bacterium SCSIO 12643]
MFRFILILQVLLIYTFSGTISAQTISGYIYDVASHQPIPFVNIRIHETTKGTTSDIDGYFKLNIRQFPVQIHIHSLGYHDTLIQINQPENQTIYLKEKVRELKAAVITSSENPAIRIIQNAIDNRDINNPEKSRSFSYETYSKMVFGPNSQNQSSDSFYENSDSNNTKKPHHLFITETVTKRIFAPPHHSYENVIANRVSGLSNPNFTLIASSFQPFSFSSDYVNIVGLNYLSPLAKNSFKNYVFELRDSVILQNDTVYSIYFQPRKGSTFSGLIGTLAINSNQFAIQNIQFKQANPNSSFEIDFEQLNAFVDSSQWFPVQFNSHIIFKIDHTDPQAIDLINANGRTYINNIQLDSEFTSKDFKNVELELDEEANQRDSLFWSQYRKEKLTSIEKNTYTIVDSIGQKIHLDRKMIFLQSLTTGLLPVGPVSLELNRILDYNEYEGIRLGAGLRTNDKISKFFSVGGYTAYGFNDQEWKYGADIQFKLDPKNDITAGIQYQNDVTGSGQIEYFKKDVFNLRSYSDLYLSRMDQIEGYQAYFTFRSFKDFQNKVFFNSYSQSFNYPYSYVNSNDTVLTSNQAFQRNEIGWSFRFGFREKYVRSFGQNISLGTKFPYVWARITHGNTLFGNDFTYTKIDARITKSFLIKGLGRFGFQLDGGTNIGEAPASLYHYQRGMRIDGFNLYIENAFNTMRPNEFLSQHYFSAHIHHRFGALYRTTYSAPEISVLTSLGWGTLDHPEEHQMVYSTMEKGFYESGILIDNLLILNTSGIGFGAFYRYGPYQLPNAAHNFGFSFTLLYVLQ